MSASYGTLVWFNVCDDTGERGEDPYDQEENEGQEVLLGAIKARLRIYQDTYYGYVALLEPLDPLAAAESCGKQLAFALLWAAISTGRGMRVSPAEIEDVEELRRRGKPGHHHAPPYETVEARELIRHAKPVLEKDIHVDEKVVLSMELFAASKFERGRSRFITLVSALEPLANRHPLGEQVRVLVDTFLKLFREASDIPNIYRQSLEGRIEELKLSSTRQAILSLVRSYLPGDVSASNGIDHAYNLRSKILHEGIAVDSLSSEITVAESHIRKLYAAITGLALV